MHKPPLQHIPFFPLLLPLFFALHGYAEHATLHPVREAAEVFVRYAGIAMLVWLVLGRLYRNGTKAALLTAAWLALELFFGSLKDFLHRYLAAPFSSYTVLLPVLLLAVLFLAWRLRGTAPSPRLVAYLNLLLLVLIAIDAVAIVRAGTRQRLHVEAVAPTQAACDTCARPDIYLLVLDEYAGKQQLQEQFGFDNTPFEDSLRALGFRVLDSTRSNYNFTVYSMASMLNMDYLEGAYQPGAINHRDIFSALRLIESNEVSRLLRQQGYEISNHSIFDLETGKAPQKTRFFPPLRDFFTASTLSERLRFDFGARLAGRDQLDELLYQNVRINDSLEAGTRRTAKERSDRPRFVYTHLLLPHHPYFFDRQGRPRAREKLSDAHKSDRAAYLGYLQYANQRVLDLVRHLKAVSAKPPLILLLSDHGFHQFDGPVDARYHFMNLNAVLLPPGSSAAFYDGMSLVNEFRILLNGLFGLRLPAKPDRSVLLKEDEGITPRKFQGD